MADDIVIRAEGLGKKYIIGHEAQRERYVALRDVIARNARNVWRKAADMAKGRIIVPGDTVEEFWALKDVNFEVKRGEVLGIIGRNGAGKSTLLKILSRITEPTEGRVTVKGRVASLLEVGTGFHPELTGRENIYLNGAILGMTRAEIKRKFDEIVAFAEVEKFLDTPVKRYSSGMYVRLAFAVAAHLEPEILIVDEVLAVGDAEFQKKCLGKMQDVAGHGRTVLFVSHNMGAIKALCKRGMLLAGGKKKGDGLVEVVIEDYLRGAQEIAKCQWRSDTGIGDENARLFGIRVRSKRDATNVFLSSADTNIEIDVEIGEPRPGLCVGFDLVEADGTVAFRAYDTDDPSIAEATRATGRYTLECTIPRGLLHGKTYGVAPRISVHCEKWILQMDPVVSFTVTLDHGQSPYWAVLDGRNRPGVIAPIFQWLSRQDNCIPVMAGESEGNLYDADS